MFRNDLFDDIEREMERDMARVQKEFDRFLREATEAAKKAPGPGGPFVWGYTFTLGPDGQPKLERFGNVSGGGGDGGWEPSISEQVDPRKGQLHITADLPGVEKKDVKLHVAEDMLRIEAKSRDRTYTKEHDLVVMVVPGSAKATFNNGLLDVTLDLAKPSASKGVDVRVQ